MVIPIDVGTIIDGRYTLLSTLGSGSSGQTYRAFDKILGREIAVKILSAELVSDVESRERFLQEGKILCKLLHENLVRIYRLGFVDDIQPFWCMEFIQGQSLSEYLAVNGALSPEKTLELFIQICSAVSYVHRSSVVHRDLKPANIMILESGEDFCAKVIDFGLCKPWLLSDGIHTRQGSVLGTLNYMSPEQCTGRSASTASDVYSLGCVLYECLTGRRPYDGNSAMVVIQQHVHQTPLPPSHFAKRIPPQMESICLKALSKAPSDRFQDAGELLQNLLLLRLDEGDRPSDSAQQPSKAGKFPPMALLSFCAGLLTVAWLCFGPGTSYVVLCFLHVQPIAQSAFDRCRWIEFYQSRRLKDDALVLTSDGIRNLELAGLSKSKQCAAIMSCDARLKANRGTEDQRIALRSLYMLIDSCGTGYGDSPQAIDELLSLTMSNDAMVLLNGNEWITPSQYEKLLNSLEALYIRASEHMTPASQLALLQLAFQLVEMKGVSTEYPRTGRLVNYLAYIKDLMDIPPVQIESVNRIIATMSNQEPADDVTTYQAINHWLIAVGNLKEAERRHFKLFNYCHEKKLWDKAFDDNLTFGSYFVECGQLKLARRCIEDALTDLQQFEAYPKQTLELGQLFVALREYELNDLSRN